MAIEIKPSHKGRLHKALGVPEGEKLSLGSIMKAKASAKASGNSALVKQATFAANASKWNKK